MYYTRSLSQTFGSPTYLPVQLGPSAEQPSKATTKQRALVFSTRQKEGDKGRAVPVPHLLGNL